MRLNRFALERALPQVYVLIYGLAVTVGTFIGGLWAGVGIGGGILLFVGSWIVEGRAPRPDPKVLTFVLSFLGLILLLNVHSHYPDVSWRLLWQEATIVLPLAVFSSPQVQARLDDARLWRIVAVAAIVGAGALGLEFLSGTPLLHAVKGINAGLTIYNRGISYLAVLAFPLLAYLWLTGRRWQALVLLCVLAVPVELTDSRATRTAILLGLATTLAAFLMPLVTRGFLSLAFLALLAMPWGVTHAYLNDQTWIRHLPPSWQHRVEIWDYMSYRIFEHPYLGWGLGSSRFLDFALPNGDSYVWITENAGHPHNGILQLWVELGLPGLLLGTVFALFSLWRCASLPRSIAPFAYGAWVAALAVSLVAYNFWDDSLFSLFALTLLCFQRLGGRARSEGAVMRPATLETCR